MDGGHQNYNLFSLSMGSTDGFSMPNSKPSAQNKMKPTRLTLFHGLLDGNSLNQANLEDGFQKESSPSDCQSGISGSDDNIDDEHHQQQQLPRDPVSGYSCSRRHEWEEIHEVIKRKFVLSMSSCGFNAEVESVKKNHYSDVMSRAKFQSFSLYLEAMKLKRGGNPNLKYAWYGASKTEVQRIFSHRFALPMNSGEFGQGVYLSPVNHPYESMHSASADEDGLRHMVLCRVILGNMEVVRPGSGQYNPSSDEFDSGVDDLASPKKYIIWNGDMNTHILPEFLVSFRICNGDRGSSQNQRVPQPIRLPNSDWMPFEALVNELSKFLPSDAIRSVAKFHNEYKKQKITRQEMIQKLRNIAGDKLLVSILKYSRDKMKGFRSCSVHSFNK